MFVEEFRGYQDRRAAAELPAKRYRNPLKKALRWKAIIQRERGLSNARLAKRLGRSRVSVTQYMNLLRLPDWIQTKILNTSGISERALRPLIKIKNERVLRAAFQEILNQAVSPQNGDRNGSKFRH